jgi:2-polyprenyl-6-methoxyphenol hydroxylase-like FAD-dependent oxidoreductase
VVVDCPGPVYAPATIFMACGRGGYVGLVRLEDGRLDLAAALDAGSVRREGGPGPAAVRVLSEVGWPVPDGLAAAGWRGTAPLTRHPQRPAAPRVFALGDAAGYVEPFTGEGMAWALASAAALAPLAAAASRHWRPEMAGRWAALHRRVVGRRQGPCRAIAAVLRRPFLTRLAVAALARAPALALPVLHYLNGPRRLAPLGTRP